MVGDEALQQTLLKTLIHLRPVFIGWMEKISSTTGRKSLRSSSSQSISESWADVNAAERHSTVKHLQAPLQSSPGLCGSPEEENTTSASLRIHVLSV